VIRIIALRFIHHWRRNITDITLSSAHCTILSLVREIKWKAGVYIEGVLVENFMINFRKFILGQVEQLLTARLSCSRLPAGTCPTAELPSELLAQVLATQAQEKVSK